MGTESQAEILSCMKQNVRSIRRLKDLLYFENRLQRSPYSYTIALQRQIISMKRQIKLVENLHQAYLLESRLARSTLPTEICLMISKFFGTDELFVSLRSI